LDTKVRNILGWMGQEKGPNLKEWTFLKECNLFYSAITSTFCYARYFFLLPASFWYAGPEVADPVIVKTIFSLKLILDWKYVIISYLIFSARSALNFSFVSHVFVGTVETEDYMLIINSLAAIFLHNS